MRITISHNHTKAEVRESVDRTFNEIFQGLAGLPLQVLVQQRSWQGDVLNFTLSAKMGPLNTPIKGTIEVTDRDLTMDVDWGILNRLIPEKAASEVIGKRIKGLLK
jgi:hypothetical protein